MHADEVPGEDPSICDDAFDAGARSRGGVRVAAPSPYAGIRSPGGEGSDPGTDGYAERQAIEC